MKLRIPEFYKPTLQKLAVMSEPDREAIGTALQTSTISLKTENIAKQAQKHYKGDTSELKAVIRMLIGLNMTRINFDLSVEEFAKDIADSIQEEEEFDSQSFDRPRFIQQLASLFEIPSIDISSRASEVQHEYEKVFRSARILTDLRPLFGPSGTEVLGMMIVHNLEISYTEGHEHREVFFAMEEADLSLLRKAVDRAELKGASLQQIIKKSETSYFDSK